MRHDVCVIMNARLYGEMCMDYYTKFNTPLCAANFVCKKHESGAVSFQSQNVNWADSSAGTFAHFLQYTVSKADESEFMCLTLGDDLSVSRTGTLDIQGFYPFVCAEIRIM